MSTNQACAIPETSCLSWLSADTPSPGQLSQGGRQFKHFVVTADDERFKPHKKQKRNRIKIACSECNLRKIKCSGSRPICKGCQKSKVRCIYRDEDGTRQDGSQGLGEAALETNDWDDDGVASETMILPAQVPPIRAIRAPQFHASLEEHFESVSTASAVNLHSGPFGGSPIMVRMTPSDIFQSQSPKPILGSRRDSHDSTQIRIPYFRWFGPTGIVPGFTKVLVDLSPTGSEKSASSTSSPAQIIYPATPHPQAEGSQQNAVSSDLGEQNDPSLFDDEDEMVPNSEILVHLLPIFFDFFGSHFPFYQEKRFMELARLKSVPAVLLNSMCALASRFSNHPRIRRDPIYLCGELFGNKAKQIVIISLAVPSYDLVASLLMLSWYEFGCNRDVGFWMYTGMATRMAQDLGMHKGTHKGYQNRKACTQDTVSSGDTEKSRDSGEDRKVDENENAMHLNLFWSIYFIDRIISLGTGRPLTLRDEQISCPLPPDSASQLNKSNSPSPFPYMIRIMMIQGKANEEISTIRQPKDLTPSKRITLFSLQDQIIHIYTSLDPRLIFNVNNFRNSISLGYGGSFLLLHVWFHAVIITIHRPGLMFGKGTLAHTLGSESLEVSMSSANTITSILALAELIDDKTITGSPFLNQAIYIAALAFIAESEMHGEYLTATPELDDQRNETPQTDGSIPTQYNFPAQGLDVDSTAPTIPTKPRDQPPEQSSLATAASQFNRAPFEKSFNASFDTLPAATSQCMATASSSLLQFASKRNYETCLNAIKTLKTVWRGIGWILSTMEQKAKGVVKTDPAEESVDPEARIDLRDAGMLRSLLAVKSGQASKGTSMPSSGLYPAHLTAETGEAWGIGRDNGWSTYGLAQNGVGIGDTWLDLTWVDSLDQNATFTGIRQDWGPPDSYSGVWALQ